MSQLETINRCL